MAKGTKILAYASILASVVSMMGCVLFMIALDGRTNKMYADFDEDMAEFHEISETAFEVGS